MPNRNRRRALVLAICSLATAPVLADPPEWAKGRKGEGRGEDRHDERGEDRREDGSEERGEHGHQGIKHFGEDHRSAVREYYAKQYDGHGKCPPGLAKKENGCLPPGQARNWEVGKPLPATVKRYAVPQELVVKMGTPPPGYQYVRVASDILMVAAGTAIVADAIKDLGK